MQVSATFPQAELLSVELLHHKLHVLGAERPPGLVQVKLHQLLSPSPACRQNSLPPSGACGGWLLEDSVWVGPAHLQACPVLEPLTSAP